MKTPAEHQNGIVAIFDALGAARYSDAEVDSFLKSRSNVLWLLTQKIEGVLGFDSNRVSVFTFNDTILIILKCGSNQPKLNDITAFFIILRKFLVDSMQHQILFRGSISIGSFHVNDETNTVMGQAVTDAASWYDKADWIGLHATPRATLVIQKILERSRKTKKYVMLDYNVPLKKGNMVCAKVVNWPKVFFIPSISPCTNKNKAKEKVLELLSVHQVPFGTESKFFNTIQFFDFAVEKIKENRKIKARKIKKVKKKASRR